MATQCTQALSAQLQAMQRDPAGFIAEFNAWKALGTANEYSTFLFGKDGAYGKLPLPMTLSRLMHVHLPPILDEAALNKWKWALSKKRRKVSDRVLVYADAKNGNYLLIFILDEPTAHEIVKMKNLTDKNLMRQFVTVAENWALTGNIEA